MQNTLIKKSYLGYIIGAALAIMIAAPLMLVGNVANAAQLDVDDMFGAETTGGFTTGSAFAGEIGLGEADLIDSIASIIRVALGFLGIIAVVIILLGGFKWMTSGGNTDKTADAKKLIFAGIIGLIIVLSAYAIAQFVISSIADATTVAPLAG